MPPRFDIKDKNTYFLRKKLMEIKLLKQEGSELTYEVKITCVKLFFTNINSMHKQLHSYKMQNQYQQTDRYAIPTKHFKTIAR